jgi:DNA-binding NarL/FixJ family response regulator
MRILVVDDHSLVRDGITSMLEAAGYKVVGQSGDGESAVSEALRLLPDVVLLDIAMPKMNGIEALRMIREAAPQIKVVMLTISEDENYLIDAIQLGASGYMLKSSSGEEFLGCLKSLEDGDLALNRSTATHLIQSLMEVKSSNRDQEARLTNREREILQLVAEGFSNKVIGQRLSVSENTVKYHIKKILQKLNAQNRTEAVAYALRSGLLKKEAA